MFSELSNTLVGKPFVSDNFNPYSLAPPGLFEAMIIEAGFEKDSLESSNSQYPIDFTNDPELYMEVPLVMDFNKVFQSVEKESLRSEFVKQVPKFLKTEENGTLVSVENIYKLIVAFKPK
jgi:hypothetical protein